jgi:uncharacterized protein (TIGR03435 family)
MNRRVAWLAATVAVAGALLPATAAQELRFDAASIKVNRSGDARVSGGIRGRTYAATNMPLRMVIMAAYDLQLEDFRLEGGPRWLSSDRFDIVATSPENATARDVPAMLRALLAERFKLVVRTEMRDAPGYALVLARRDGRLGPSMKQAALDCAAEEAAGRTTPRPEPGQDGVCRRQIADGIMGRGQPMSSLARMVTVFVQRRVEDRTGLTGGFDFDLRPLEPGTDLRSDNAAAVFTALQEQLGLRLEGIRAPAEFVVIESVEPPVEN